MESLGGWFLRCCLWVLTIGNRTANSLLLLQVTLFENKFKHNKNLLVGYPSDGSAFQASLDQQTKSHPSLLNYLSDGGVSRNEKNDIKT
jgi:hypothetical protein